MEEESLTIENTQDESLMAVDAQDDVAPVSNEDESSTVSDTACESPTSDAEKASLTVSVVIPTYNESKRIGDCLRALKEGSMQPLEIIVADGKSKDNTVEIAKEYGATVVVNEKRHAAGGRNAGLAAAKGDIIAFIDADCIPDRDWLREIHKAFIEDDIDGLGTYIEPAEPANKYEEFWGRLSLQILMSYGDEPYYVTEKTLNTAFITASCAYKRDLLNKLGGFSDYFANNAEDIDLCWRAFDSGAKLKYVPTAKIIAHSPTTLKGICKKSFRNGISSSKLQKVYSGKRFCIDTKLYKAFWANFFRMFIGRKHSFLFVAELFCHLAGKYWGSIKCGIINL
ncbi:MAG: glycosyltransferase [Clostridiales bacterium]|nr:glycosyltransferase [Clostridiales bacterium]